MTRKSLLDLPGGVEAAEPTNKVTVIYSNIGAIYKQIIAE